MKQRSGSSSLSALKLKSFTSLVKWCAAHYTRHMKGHVSLRDLYGLCVNARTDSGKSLAVWMNQNQTIPGQITGHIFRVFSGMAVWKRLKCHPEPKILAQHFELDTSVKVMLYLLYKCNTFLGTLQMLRTALQTIFSSAVISAKRGFGLEI